MDNLINDMVNALKYRKHVKHLKIAMIRNIINVLLLFPLKKSNNTKPKLVL